MRARAARWLAGVILAVGVGGLALGSAADEPPAFDQELTTDDDDELVPADGRRPGAARPATARCFGAVPRPGVAGELEGFPALIAGALRDGDERLLEYLRARLTELIGDDPAQAGRVLGWLREAPDHDTAAIYAAALGEAPAVRDPKVRADLIALAEAGDAERQGAAFALLERQTSLAPGELERVVAAAKATPVEDNAAYALKALGQVMAESCAGDGCEAIQLGLLDVGAAAPGIDVQRFAVEMLIDVPGAMSDAVVARLGEVMTTSSVSWTRQLAASALANAGGAERVLARLRAAFLVEPDFCTRVALFRNAAAAAGPDALPLMREMASLEPRLADDVAAFERVYADGPVAFDRVVQELFDQIHLECSLGQDGPLP